MTSQTTREASDSQGWGWPLTLSSYDRTSLLSQREQIELDLFIHRLQVKKPGWPKRTYEGLQRLLRPLYDVFDFTGDCPTTRRGAIHLLFREMQRRKLAFWAWTKDQWLETLCSDAGSFEEHFRTNTCRPGVMAVAYLLCDFSDLLVLGKFSQPDFARKVFGQEAINIALERTRDELQRLGFGPTLARHQLPAIVCTVLLLNRSPRLEDLTVEVLQMARSKTPAPSMRRGYVAFSRVLVSLSILPRALPPTKRGPEPSEQTTEAVPIVWLQWCQRWYDTSTLAGKTRNGIYTHLLKVGRWLDQTHPDIISPESWTRELAAEFVAAVDRMTVGQWVHPENRFIPAEKRGKPLAPHSKIGQLAAVRVFFRECQEWGWLPRRFDPARSLAAPRSIRALTAPDPRVIADDVWAKLLWAGLHLTADDLPVCAYQTGSQLHARPEPWYPLEMVRAIVMMWLFAGLRSDELYRLRVGAVRWQREDVPLAGENDVLSKDAVCLLDVPAHKTGAAYTKPVDRVVGEAVEVWERVRPIQPAMVDAKTGEIVHYLFEYRGIHIGKSYLNTTVIPMLCHKGGLPEKDARGSITSHRARSTIASQLFNAKEPMSLFELQEWLGHRSPASTQHYAKITPTRLAKSYIDAGYFGRNTRTVEVLLDQEAIKSGAAAGGFPWKFYDLGHGYCTYDFFDQCPHRMACAKCSFYLPKESSQTLLLEGKANLQRMLQEIPLTEDERAAVEDGITAMECLCHQLADVPTPAGPTPNQLATTHPKKTTIIPLEGITRNRQNMDCVSEAKHT